MRSPLALLKAKGRDQWKVVRSERAARGFMADCVVFVREPTDAERRSIEECLSMCDAGESLGVHSLPTLAVPRGNLPPSPHP